MALSKGQKPKIPKGFEPTHTSYKLITETYYEKPFKMPKRSKEAKPKPFVQPVKIVSAKPGVLGGRGKRGRK